MKTKTYARVALLIPLVLWVILLLVELLINAVIPADLRSNGPDTFLGALEIVILVYVIGIVLWFLPYLVLSIAMLLMSYKIRMERLQYVLILSPFAMAILAMMEATLVSLPAGGFASPSADLATNFMTSIGINLMMGILSLVYGYICVGLGFAGYKLLQRFGRIKDEEKIHSEIVSIPTMGGNFSE
jgi:hypothetical protein